MKAKILCQECSTELPLTAAWKEHINTPENVDKDIEVISHGICMQCLIAVYGPIIGQEAVDDIINNQIQ